MGGWLAYFLHHLCTSIESFGPVPRDVVVNPLRYIKLSSYSGATNPILLFPVTQSFSHTDAWVPEFPPVISVTAEAHEYKMRNIPWEPPEKEESRIFGFEGSLRTTSTWFCAREKQY